MRNETRLAFNDYTARLATLNAVASALTQFTVTPSVQQTLETKIQESSDFLGKINVIGVVEKSGEKLGLGVSGPVAGRTDTSQAERSTRDVSALDARGYECRKTDFDTHITYGMLDAWAKFPDFQTRLRDAIVRRQALDRIMIGFNGTSAAATTDRNAHPLLQDVNIGWLQAMRTTNAARVLDHGNAAGKVTYGPDAGADYKNLDAIVFDAVMMLDPWFREDPDLVAIVGRGLMHDKYFPLVNLPTDPTQKLAADMIISQKRLGGLQAVQVPFFPDGTVLITSLKNLSIYWQESARRRMVLDNPKRDRIENYESSNDAYVIEQLGAAALVENIEPYEAG
jgi:P2 family phage major capsid protein